MPGSVNGDAPKLHVREQLSQLPVGDPRHSLIAGAQLSALLALINEHKEKA